MQIILETTKRCRRINGQISLLLFQLQGSKQFSVLNLKQNLVSFKVTWKCQVPFLLYYRDAQKTGLEHPNAWEVR